MKLITRDTDYALRALCFIAGREGEIVSAAELVRKLKIPRPFLRKLLQIMRRKGILIAYKGQGGGFCLNKSIDAMSLLDLIEVFQGALKINKCLFKGMCCPKVRGCLVKKEIDKIQKYALGRLNSVKIKSLLSR